MSEIEGHVEPAFAGVREAFAANFALDGPYREMGAAIAVFHRGRVVVDLWGGHADTAHTRARARHTLVNGWSATKGLTAVAIAQLVDRGRLSYETPVAEVWPAFGQAGKGEITVGQVMSHQAGLPGFAEPTTVDDQLDWDGCVGRLE